MRHSRRATRPSTPRPVLRAALLAAVVALLPAGEAQATYITDDVRPIPDSPGVALAAAASDSLFMAGADDAMESVLGAAIADAERRDDRIARLWLTRRLGELRARHGRALAAEQALRESEALAMALGDSLTLASTLRLQAWVRQQMGDHESPRQIAARMARIAALIGDRNHAAWAEIIEGWEDIIAGRLPAAIAHYESASRTFRALGQIKDEIFALNGLGLAVRQAGDYARARACFERTMAVTAGTEYRRAYGHALLQLAHLEREIGDPAEAAGLYARAYRLFRERGAANEIADPLFGLSATRAELGQFDAALAALDTVRALANANGYRDEAGSEIVARARVVLAMDQPHEALRLAGQARAMGDTLLAGARMELAGVRIAALERLGRRNEAARVLADAERELASNLPFDARLALRLRAAEFRLASGDARGAEPVLVRCAEQAAGAGLREPAMRAWLAAARAARVRGADALAMERLDRAIAEWEALRGRPSQPEWREQRGPLARDVVSETLDALLSGGPGAAPERVAAAFARLQRYKARTLLERMAGPRPDAPAGELLDSLTLSQLQRDVLRPGELVLDYFLGADRGFVFAVTRDTCVAARLENVPELRARIALYLDLLSRPPARGARGVGSGDRAMESAARHLGAALLGPVAGPLASARRVIVIADGTLHLVPFTTLAIGDGERAQALVERVVLSRAASATLLARLRARPATLAPSAVLAAADSMPGARAETAWLSGALARVRRARLSHGEGSLALGELADFGTIHYAGHTLTDDASPWRSSVPFARTAVGGPASAADVAGLRLPARLTVLSSCESAAGRSPSGEGVAGLSSAFLAAGVPLVVATLWRVEDRATNRLMRRFYSAMLAGEDAASALRSAQRTLRADPATAHPFYWAGFILVGDGTAVPNIAANPFSPRRLTVYAVGALLLLWGLGIGLRLFKSRKNPTPGV